jgi:hypothetical protein
MQFICPSKLPDKLSPDVEGSNLADRTAATWEYQNFPQGTVANPSTPIQTGIMDDAQHLIIVKHHLSPISGWH